MACATEGIYLLQTRELISMNKNIYKIGRSFNLNKRMKQYPKESNLILLVECCNSVKCEAELLKIFRKEFKESKKYGNEYFEGDKEKMKKLIFNYIEKETEDVIKEKEKVMKEKEIVNNKTCSKCKTEFKYIGNLKRHLLKSTNCKISIEEVDNIITNITSKNDDIKTDDVKTDDNKININIIKPVNFENVPNLSLFKFESIFTSSKPLFEMLKIIYLDKQNNNFFKYNMSRKSISYLNTQKIITTIDEDTFKIYLLNISIKMFKSILESIKFIAKEDLEEDFEEDFQENVNKYSHIDLIKWYDSIDKKYSYKTILNIISNIEHNFDTSYQDIELQLFLETHIREKNRELKLNILNYIKLKQ